MRPRTLPLPLALVLFLGCAASHGLDPDADAGLDVAPSDAPRSDWPFGA